MQRRARPGWLPPADAMRVLMITLELPKPGRPGTWAPVARQIDSLRALGVEVGVLQLRGHAQLKYARAVPRLLARVGGADLVHAHYGYNGWIGRTQLRRPLVVSFMGSDLLGSSDGSGRVTPWSRPVVALDRRLARLADEVIVKSPEMAEIVAPVEAHVIPNGVDLASFRPLDRMAARARLGWAPEERRVLFAGSPSNPRKAYPVTEAAVEIAAARLGARIRIVPLSGVDPASVPAYMSASDAMVLTSYWEGSPNVVKEAMACNLPVVAAPVGDVAQLLAAVTPSAVLPRRPETLGAALAEILGDRRRSNGRQAIQRLGLDLASVGQRVLGVYERILRQSRRTAPAG